MNTMQIIGHAFFVGLMITCACMQHAAPIFAQAPEAFPDPNDTQPSPSGVTSAAAALSAIKLPPGFHATLFASEPTVRQPIAMATDARGRLWIAENYTYAQREVNFDDRLRDRIVILEDSDGDGQVDKRTVFWDQASKLTSVEVGLGGVWALCPPYLLFLPDADGDDKPDGPPEVVLDGWDADDVRHNIANGLRWGPDGWLYGRHGILATSLVGTPGASPDQRRAINCGIWRYHPPRRVFEVVCTGTTNSWGMDWDEHGQFFFINTVIGHLWHVVPGAHFQRMYGEDFSPYYYELLPQAADHFHWDTREVWSDIRTKGVTPTTDQAGGGHAHSGMMIYQGGVWPRQFHNSVFTVNLHGQRLNNDRLTRHGSGYVGEHAADFMRTSDPWFRGVEVMASPDGDLFIADWSDIGECHENDGVHRSSGRIFKIAYDRRVPQDGSGSDAERPTRLAPTLPEATNSLLVANQFVRNEWTVRQSRLLLQERALAGMDMAEVHQKLSTNFQTEESDRGKLRAMWGLYVTGGTSEQWLGEQLEHASEHVRCWAVQLLCDSGTLTPEIRESFVGLARRESSGLVLQFLASALQRLAPAERWELAAGIASHQEFSEDVRLPLLVWYGIEPAVLLEPDRAVEFAASTPAPKLRHFLARRITTEIERHPAATARLVTSLGMSGDPAVQKDLLRGMNQAMTGWRKAQAPSEWSAVAEKLSAGGDAEVASLVRDLSVVFGDGRAMDELRELVVAGNADLNSRRSALRSLVAVKAEGIVAVLQRLIAERDLQTDAIRGLAAFNDPETPRMLIENFGRLHVSSRDEAITTLVARPAYAQQLVAAVEAGKIDRSALSSFHLRQIKTFDDSELSAKIAAIWPELANLSAAKTEQIARYREQLTSDSIRQADVANGRALFQRACANCHVLFGSGGKVGPDLTGGQRGNLTYLLENIVDPSATVSENFRMSIVIVADGRVLNGILADQTDKTVTVVTPTDRIVLAREEIDEIRPANLSIMPEGQLDVLRPNEVRDLIGYLMTGT